MPVGAADARIGTRLRHLMKYPDTRHFLSLFSIGVIVSPCIVQDTTEGSSQGVFRPDDQRMRELS